MQHGFLSQLRRLWIVMTILAGLAGMAFGVSMQIAASGSDCGHEQPGCCHQESGKDSCHGTLACVCAVPDSGGVDALLALPNPVQDWVAARDWVEPREASFELVLVGEFICPADGRVPADWLVDSVGPRGPPY